MKIGREIKIVSGIISFLVVFYLLNPAHESLLRLLEISGILLVTFLAFFASKNLNPRLRYRVTLLVSLVSAMLIGYVTRGKFLSLKYSFIILMLLFLTIISPYLLKLVRLEPEQELSAIDLLKIVLLAVIITMYVLGIALITYQF
ncbi:hypothetical protein [Geoglobus acetivorans]|uniref:Uncharacterized protein n=1 Tax=Geoglobus acetivorans TaxID=565033 RepID=A0ABZ3GZZ6_GEOAI|nr:hypothetical protein [Geoglobus acetivorans]